MKNKDDFFDKMRNKFSNKIVDDFSDDDSFFTEEHTISHKKNNSIQNDYTNDDKTVVIKRNIKDNLGHLIIKKSSYTKLSSIIFTIMCGEEKVLGREACDIIIPDNYISKKHIKITSINKRFYIQDIGSANGVFINGQELLEKRELANNDNIELGETLIIFKETFINYFPPKIEEKIIEYLPNKLF